MSTNAERKPNALAVTLSTLIFPGAGQLLQRRWPAAITFAALFSVAFGGFLFCALRIVLAFYGMAFDFEGSEAPVRVPRTAMLAWLGVAAAIYGASIADTYRAYRRMAAAWARNRHRPPPVIPGT